MLKELDATQIKLILETAAKIYASRRTENIALPEFDSDTQVYREELVKRWFQDQGDQEKSPSAVLHMILDEPKKYTDSFYDPALDFASIIEATSLVREKARSRMS